MADINDRIAAFPADKLQSLADLLRSQNSQTGSAVAELLAPEALHARRRRQRKIRLSFIIPWSKRPEIYVALKRNLDILANEDTEVLVITTESDVPHLKRAAANIGIPRLRMVAMRGAEFNKCTFLNLGVHCSNAESLFLLDCDTLVGRDTIEAASAALADDTFVVIREGIELDQVTSRELLLDVPCLREVLVTTELLFTNSRRVSFEHFQTNTGRSLVGLTMLNKKDFIAVEGLNSDLQGWGAEDYDFQIRLQVKAGLRRVSVGSASHLTHISSSSNTGAVSSIRNIEMIFKNYDKGDFLGTYSKDVARWGSQLQFA